MRAEAEIAPYSVQEGRYREATTALDRAKLVADAILESFFAGGNVKARDANLAEVEQLVSAPSPRSWERLATLRDRLRCSPIGITSFHWELEFDDVFTRANPGFDAIVGNPPFAGKNTIASGHPLAYPDWLKTLHPGAHGNADLAAHFFRRAFGLLRRGGAFGLIATNTIRQGDTRETGLARIVAEGGTIYRAVSRHRWEGEAAVVVSMVFVARGEGPTPVLDGRPVSRISGYLVEGELDGSPLPLPENSGKSFQGSILLGMGFTFDDVNAAKGKASPVSDMYRLIADDPRNAEVIKPFLGGEEVSNSPTHSHHRYAINLLDWPLRRESGGVSWASLSVQERASQVRKGIVAADYPYAVAADRPEILRIVERMVRPDRSTDKREVYRNRWWQYAEKRTELYRALEGQSRTLVALQTSPHHAIAFAPADVIFSQTLVVFALSSQDAFAAL